MPNERDPWRRVPHWCNGRSLSGDGSHTGEVVRCWDLFEQGRHEHMSDEYKTSIILMYFGNPHPRYQIHERPQRFHYRTEQKGEHQADKHWLSKYV